MKKIFSLILTSCLLFSASCSKDDGPSCEGCIDDKVTCRIDGEKWSDDCEPNGIFGCKSYDCRFYHLDSRQFELVAGSAKDSSGIQMVVSSLTGGLKLGANQLGIVRGAYSVGKCGWFYTDSTKPRTVTIHQIDTIARVIEGEFEYSAVGECGDTVHITDGYFKVKYKHF